MNGLLNRDFESILSVFPRKHSETQSSLEFLQSGPRKFTKSDFSGLAPIQQVPIVFALFPYIGGTFLFCSWPMRFVP